MLSKENILTRKVIENYPTCTLCLSYNNASPGMNQCLWIARGLLVSELVEQFVYGKVVR
jgi:hypothetical protein